MGIRYNPALDGLRALAALAVVGLHCHLRGFAGGYLGVDVFFVLSGFLITSILLSEHERTGRIALVAFYLRRARRLYPALLLMLAVYLSLAWIIWPGHDHGNDALIAGTYLADYAISLWHHQLPYLGHTWSLAVEEQFYLLWPPLLIVMLRHKTLPELSRRLAMLVLFAYAWRTFSLLYLGDAVGYRFDTRMVGLLAGCWLAVTMKLGTVRIPRPVAGWFGLALLAWLFWAEEHDLHAQIVALPLVELAAVGVVYGAASLPIAPLAYMGQLSYGIYLWHFPIATALFSYFRLESDQVAWITYPASIALAALSYHTVERHALSLRKQRIPDNYQPAE